MDASRVDPKDYVPNAEQLDRTTQRIYSFFGTNDDIVQSKWDEDKWLAYYESELEPLAIQLSGEYSRKLFTRRERAFGNSIIFPKVLTWRLRVCRRNLPLSPVCG